MTHEDKRFQRLQVGRTTSAARAARANARANCAVRRAGTNRRLRHGCDETPPRLRLGFKILGDAGYVPVGRCGRSRACAPSSTLPPTIRAARALRGCIAALQLAIELRAATRRHGLRRARR